MNDAETILLDVAEQQGWSLATQYQLLLRFIDEQKATAALQSFLTCIADEENEYDGSDQ